MAKPTGFLEYERKDPKKRPVNERLQDHREVEQHLPSEDLETQAARCMDCGIPFCHGYGCPLQNLIPDFNDLVYRGQWQKALALLHSQNNFPEFTGRVCPAPCETSCTLGINQPPVSIREIELQIVEHGWNVGWIHPEPPVEKTGKRIAVVGSGPAGLAAAQQLTRFGHDVTVYEKDDRPGGILRYGIPDFKLDKSVLDRRITQMQEEGTLFETGVSIGEDIAVRYLCRAFDAVVISGGARVPRDLDLPGRELQGIHFAMDFLTQENRRVMGDAIPADQEILATGKNVVIIGGGDTGADCLGTALRQNAKEVTQFEIMPEPPEQRDPSTPWPEWPYMLRKSSSHEEGGQRYWSIQTKTFLGEGEHVQALDCAEVQWTKDAETGKSTFYEKEGTAFRQPADLVILAMGFTPQGNVGVLNSYGVEVDERGNAILDNNFMSNVPGVFVAGDLSKGASLVVRAINDGRCAAEGVDRYVRG